MSFINFSLSKSFAKVTKKTQQKITNKFTLKTLMLLKFTNLATVVYMYIYQGSSYVKRGLILAGVCLPSQCDSFSDLPGSLLHTVYLSIQTCIPYFLFSLVVVKMV
jgi:hypothetical protein